MSTFKGTYFKYDVGLLDQALIGTGASKTLPEAIEPANFSVDFLTFAEKVTLVPESDPADYTRYGTINAVEVLSVKILGQGVSDGYFVYSSDATHTGTYVIKAKLTYTEQEGSASATKECTFKLPIPFDTQSADNNKSEVQTSFGKTYIVNLPSVAAAEFTPTNDGAKLTILISTTAVSKTIAGVNINEKELTFNQGFISQAKVSGSESTGGSISVKINGISPAATAPSNALSIEYSTAGESSIKSISEFIIKKIEATVTIASGKVSFTTFVFHYTSFKGTAGSTPTAFAKVDGTITATLNNTSKALQFDAVVSGNNFSVYFRADQVFVCASFVDSNGGAIFAQDDSVSFAIGLFPFKFADTRDKPTGAITYRLDCDEIIEFNSTAGSAKFYAKGLNFNEQLHFLDKSKKTSITALAPATGLYEQFPAPATGNLVDVTTDAGFVIPAVVNGKYETKYIRISDLYNAIINLPDDESADIPELADRLHALEVGLDNVCSATLEEAGSSEAEAQRLYLVKNKWKILDISNLA